MLSQYQNRITIFKKELDRIWRIKKIFNLGGKLICANL